MNNLLAADDSYEMSSQKKLCYYYALNLKMVALHGLQVTLIFHPVPMQRLK